MGRQISDDYRGQPIHLLALVVEAVHSGITTEFLMSDLKAQGGFGKAGDIAGPPIGPKRAVAAGLFRLLVDEAFLVGYGLGPPEQTNRDLPYIGAAS